MHTYAAYYNSGTAVEIMANSLLEAKTKAVEHFKPRKSQQHMVHVYLAKLSGQDIAHTADAVL